VCGFGGLANLADRREWTSAVFENTCFFSDFKKHDFLRIFEMTYQKV